MLKFGQLKQAFYTWVPCVLLIVLAFCLQARVYMHADNAYLLHTTSLLISGGSYLKDYFEINPPLIMLLYAPVMYIVKYTSANIFLIFYGYITLIGCLSLLLSYLLLQKLFANKNLVYLTVFVSLLTIFFLPVVSFGQRENLFIMLTLPYLWLAMLRRMDKPISSRFAMLVGLLAGVGMCLKPYFFTLPIFIEMYFVIYYKNLFAWVRDETLAILFVMVGYLCSVLLFFPDYAQIVLPMVIKYYYTQHSFMMLADWIASYVLMIGLGGLLLLMRGLRPVAIQILLLALAALVISYILSGQAEFYHHLPMMSLAVILAFFCCWYYLAELLARSPAAVNLTVEWLFWILACIVVYFITPLDAISGSRIIILAIRFFLAMLAIVSIIFVYQSMRRIFQNEFLLFLNINILVLSVFFSAKPFGQYAQLLILFTLPYIFGLMVRWQYLDDQPRYVFIKGLMLGMAFCIDPYLLLLVVVLEGPLILRQKKISWRAQQEIIVAVIILAGFYSGIIQQLLLWCHINIAYVSEYYYGSLIARLPKNEAQLENTMLYYEIFVLIISVIHCKSTRYLIVNRILLLSLLGFIGFAFIGKTAFGYYASLPALCVANLLIALMSGEMILAKPRLLALQPALPRLGVYGVCVLTITVAFLCPLKLTMRSFVENAQFKNNGELSSIISYFNQYPGSTYDYFSAEDSLILINNYSDAHFVGQFGGLWWLASLDSALSMTHEKASRERILRDKLFFVNMIAKNLNVKKPRFVLEAIEKKSLCSFHVNTAMKKEERMTQMMESYHCHEEVDPDADYIHQLSENPLFRAAWQHYKYADTIGDYAIYQRIS